MLSSKGKWGVARFFFGIQYIPCSVLCDRRERSIEQGAYPRHVAVLADRREDGTATAPICSGLACVAPAAGESGVIIVC